MNSVKVRRTELLEKVKQNLQAHRDLYNKAKEGYRAAVIAALERMLSHAKAGKHIDREVSVPEPVDRRADYERVITMLEMSADDIIELSS